MDTITEFESSSPKADGEDALNRGFDYGLVIQALAVGGLSSTPDGIVAENVLARCAKRQVRQMMGKNISMMRTSDGYLPHITWHSAVSMTAEVPVDCDASRTSELAGALFLLGQRMGRQIVESRESEDKKILLLDALTIQILEIGLRCFSFRLSQKWGVE